MRLHRRGRLWIAGLLGVGGGGLGSWALRAGGETPSGVSPAGGVWVVEVLAAGGNAHKLHARPLAA